MSEINRETLIDWANNIDDEQLIKLKENIDYTLWIMISNSDNDKHHLEQLSEFSYVLTMMFLEHFTDQNKKALVGARAIMLNLKTQIK